MSAASLNSAPPALRDSFLKGLTQAEAAFLLEDWLFWARPDQLPPPGDWVTWLILGGRGAGKTRAGAEWIKEQVSGRTPLGGGSIPHVALIGETYHDVRDVMVEGPSGLMALGPNETRPKHEKTRRRLVWPNGATASYFSSEDPDGLRGPQFFGAWADEFCKWRYITETWDNLQFALRLGDQPRQVVTTTPRPIPELKRLMEHDNMVVTKASTYANKANLASSFFKDIIQRYEGTRLGRQELNAEILEDNQHALWSWPSLEEHRVRHTPALRRVVVAVDPPVSSGKKSDECGIIVAGVSDEGHGYVLGDYSLQGLAPKVWADEAIKAYHAHDADRLVAEVNQGGDMVRTIVTQLDPTVAFLAVHASRGKVTRAEPVAALYEQGRVHHVGSFSELEDQMCSFSPLWSRGDGSPDRVDALVWALTVLMLQGEAGAPMMRRV